MTNAESTTAKHILLVDDDETFCRVMSRALERRGYTVDSANTTVQALELCEQQVMDYCVVDLKLENESGLALIPQIKQRLPQAVIVVLTGYASIATTIEAIKLGAAYYLAKPVDADTLIASFSRTDASVEQPIAGEPMSVQKLEWEHIQRVLAEHDGNVSATARALNMHRRTLQRKLQKHAIKR